MSTDQPMRGPSVPAEEVEGPTDLVMRMNVATSEEWEQVPLPARQQLGWHEPYEEKQGIPAELKDYTGLEPRQLVHAPELSGSHPDAALDLVSSVTYHLEATPPPAEPAGAPGSDGYNRLNRGVPPAAEFEHPADFTLEQGANVRTFRLPEGESLSEAEQAKVDGVGPNSPTRFMTDVELVNATEDTRQRSSQTPSVNDPYRNPDGSLKDPVEVQAAAPAYPDSDFGSKELLEGDAPAVEAAVDTEGAKAAEGTDPADGPDQTVAPAGGGSDVPDGTVKEVLDWVGDDAARARAALEAEQAKDSPRTSLVSQLNDKV